MQIPESPHIRKLLSMSEMIDRHTRLGSINIQCQNIHLYYFLKNTIHLNPVFYISVNIFKLKKTHTIVHKTSCINISAEKQTFSTRIFKIYKNIPTICNKSIFHLQVNCSLTRRADRRPFFLTFFHMAASFKESVYK